MVTFTTTNSTSPNGSSLHPVADRLRFGRGGRPSCPKRQRLLGEVGHADFTMKNCHVVGYEWEYQGIHDIYNHIYIYYYMYYIYIYIICIIYILYVLYIYVL